MSGVVPRGLPFWIQLLECSAVYTGGLGVPGDRPQKASFQGWAEGATSAPLLPGARAGSDFSDVRRRLPRLLLSGAALCPGLGVPALAVDTPL